MIGGVGFYNARCKLSMHWACDDMINCVGTAQKMKFPIKYFFSKCDQIDSFLQIWSSLLKKPLKENYIFLYSVAVSCHKETSDLQDFELFCLHQNLVN